MKSRLSFLIHDLVNTFLASDIAIPSADVEKTVGSRECDY